MPSGTSLLETEEAEPGLGVQGQSEPRETLLQPCPGSHLGLLGTVLDLQPLRCLSLQDEEKGDGGAAEETEAGALLAQAPIPAFAALTLTGMDASDTAALYGGGAEDGPAPQQHVPGMMAVTPVYAEPGFETEASALVRRKSVNTTECVAVPSSEHVAEIVGRQGCKIKALRAKTNTYIKTPVRGEQPVFVVTGRKEDVAMAKREILSAAEHFSLIRASRHKPLGSSGLVSCAPMLPGQTTIQVRVPYRVVGLVVGPKGATIKRIQQQTHTYIVTPSRDKEPVFEVTGMPENVDRAREEIEAHIAMRTGSCVEPCSDENDFHCNGTDVSFEGDVVPSSGGQYGSSTVPAAGGQHGSCVGPAYHSCISSSGDFYSSGRMADFSPTGPVWFGDNPLSLGSEDLELPGFEALSITAPPMAGHQVLWNPFEQGLPLLEGHCSGPSRDSQPGTPRASPTFHDALELPGSRHARSDPVSTRPLRFPVCGMAFSSSSSGDSTTSSSPPDSAGPVGPYRGRQDCVRCLESESVAALVPCGHSFFCMECANHICQAEEPVCPVCLISVTQALLLRNM